MKKLSNSEAESKKALLIKKRVYKHSPACDLIFTMQADFF